MPITKIEPNIIDTTADFTFNNVTATGNLTSLNANLGNAATANFFIGSGNNLSNIQGANVSGQVGNALVAGTVYTSSQPNITSVGTLTGLTSTGTANLTGASNVALGPVGNVHITGGSSGQYLQTDGSGSLSWATVATGSTSNISNGNSNVSIPSANGNVNISAVGNVNVLVITGTGANITGTLNVTGNANVDNIGATNGVFTNVSGNGSSLSSITGANVTGQVANAIIAGTVYTNAQPNITSIGTLTSLNVNGTLTAVAFTANTGVFTGNGNGLSSIVGANVTGTVANATYAVTAGSSTTAGTVTTNAQPNITSVGTLTTVSVSGNANTGNLGTTNLVATGTGSFGANVNMNTYWINNVGYPSATTDAASKAYVDTMVSSGISYHQPVVAATTTTLATATGGTVSYNNGTAGVGANLVTTGTFNLIDTANVQTVGTRILVKNEANATWNGIYEYTSTTVITRTADADEYGPDSTQQLSINDYFFTTGGSVNKGVAFVVSAPAGTIVFGTSNITFAQFSSSQVYDAGTGLTLTGTTFSVNASQTQITSVGTLTGLAVNGNITAANITANTGVFTGNGNGLSSIVGANVTGAVSYATTANAVAGANVSGQVANALVAGTVYTNAQPNITSVGTLSSLDVTGNITSGNANLGNLVTANFFTGNGSLLTGITTGGISNGNSNISIPSANGNINFSAEGNANVVVVTGTGLNVTGILDSTGNFHTSASANIDGLLTVSSSNGNDATKGIAFPLPGGAGADSNASIRYYHYGSYYQTVFEIGVGNNTIFASGQDSINLVASGGVGVKTQTPSVEFEVTGRAKVSGNTEIGGILLATGNANFTGANVTLGSVSNLHISGGSSGQYLQTDGSGTLTWVSISSSSTLANGNSSVNIPSANGNVNITAVGNANILVVTGTGSNINGTLNVTGNANVGNLGVTGVYATTVAGSLTTAAQGNITSVGTLSNLAVTGNITSGNANLGNNVSANFFTGNGIYLTGITTAGIANGNSNISIPSANGNVNISAVGNANILVVTGTGANITGTLNVTGDATVGNLTTGGAGGNITGANVISANTFTASGNITAGNANLGNATTANYFIGSGNNLSNIQGSNVTGAVGLATYATTANSVAGANVSGQVSNALVAGTVYTNAQPNITSVGTLSSLAVTANITSGNANLGNNVSANFFTGNGIYLTGITTAGIANGNSNVNIPSANGNVNISAVGNANILVVTGTGANITGTANVTGSIAGGGELNISGNSVIGGNLTVNGTLTYINSTTLSISDPIINLQTGANGAAPVANSGKDVGTALNYYDTSAKIAWMGWDVSNAEIAFGANVGISSEVVTFTTLANTRSGNAQLGNAATANYFIGSGANLTNIPAGNISGQVANALVAGTVYTNAQPNITSVGTLTSLGVTGNITSGNANLGNAVTANYFIGNFYGTANLATYATTANAVAGANVSGQVANALVAGTVYTNAQSNITSVGSLTGLTVSNATGVVNFTTTANVTLGAVGNLHITGGTANYVLKTDGAGNLDWVAQSGGNAANVTVDNFTGNGVQTIFTLSTTPIGINQTSVNYNGATVLRTDYSLTGANITFSSAPANGSLIEITTINLTSGGGGGGITAQDLLSPFLLMGA